ncbi:MAG TPA: proline--tRNA ligase [Candidatus Paceibacterota bacterium]|jgi:prolyl-tRNA synthetase|nr:proline--tRNA ligase [Candidatus Paceibacterota bacterium]HQC46379.1 proline--tRNA ligase [Candidatus Paceibacterota bacterium]
MEQSKFEDKKITTRAEDYNEWYLDVIEAAGLAENAPVKGCMVIKPSGYAIWEKTQKILDEMFKQTGVENAYFPMLIPEKFLKREEEHVEGFSPEVALVNFAGGKKLEEPLVLRPTSETIMYDVFSRWVRSHRDLPLLINQWANVIRWEMRTKLFLRTTEFLWQEGHTVHATYEDAESRVLMMLNIYKKFAEEYMAIPVIAGKKSESEKFAGASGTYTIETMMQDGKALQFATSHNLGQNFAKVFDVTFLDENNERQFAWQTSWGLSTRVIGGLIMTHSDDKGLVLPPKIAPIQVVIIPIIIKEWDKQLVEEETRTIMSNLQSLGVSVKLDNRDLRPGEKYYEWEKKGIPVRIEVGPKDLANNSVVLARRDTAEKKIVSLPELSEIVIVTLGLIQESLYKKAEERLKENTVSVDNWDDFVKAIENNKFVKAHWSGDEDVALEIKEQTGATVRCFPLDQEKEEGKCIKSGKPSVGRVVFAKSY